MTIKFIALDTDGTLLNSTGKILPSTKNSFRPRNKSCFMFWSANRRIKTFYGRIRNYWT